MRTGHDSDSAVKSDIARQWTALRKLCRSSHRQGIAPGVFINETPPEEIYNLPLVLAYAVLDEVLSALISQGTFACRDWTLGAKMGASSKPGSGLQWKDYDLVARGKEARNDLAHEAKLLAKADCFRFIDAIEGELKARGLI